MSIADLSKLAQAERAFALQTDYANLLALRQGLCKYAWAMDDLITTSDAAELLGKSIGTINRWVIEGRLTPAFDRGGRTSTRLYNRADIEALVEHQEAAS